MARARSWIVAGTVLASLVNNPVAAQAATVRVTHVAPVPCVMLCSYWPAADAMGFSPCSDPFPEGSYDQTIFKMTSTKGIVHIAARSEIDYDTFVCTATNPPVLIFQMANAIGDECDGIAGHSVVGVGCLEEGDLTFRALIMTNGGGPGYTKFMVRSYNWSDNAGLKVKLTGPVAIVNDRYASGLPSL